MSELITTQPAEIVANSFCRDCGRRLKPADNFCAECGTDRRDLIEIVDPVSRIVPAVAVQSSTIVETGDDLPTVNAIVNNRWAVIGIIALLGPLGLPALWVSQRFSKQAKILTTTGYVLLAFVFPIFIAWYWMDYSLRPLVEVFGQ